MKSGLTAEKLNAALPASMKMKVKTKKANAIPPSLPDRLALCRKKAAGFKILLRITKNAGLTKDEAEKVSHCLASCS
jgi:hypothetical protein